MESGLGVELLRSVGEGRRVLQLLKCFASALLAAALCELVWFVCWRVCAGPLCTTSAQGVKVGVKVSTTVVEPSSSSCRGQSGIRLGHTPAVYRGLFLVTPGAQHHLLMLTQPDQVQVRKAPLVTPKVAVQDVADNIVQLESQIAVSLVSNGSRPHDWIPHSDMVPIMKSLREEQGIEDVKNVVDDDLKTFYQIPPGENMTFDLLHRYNIQKIKLQCAVVRDDFNITEMRAEDQGLPSPFIVTIPAST